MGWFEDQVLEGGKFFRVACWKANEGKASSPQGWEGGSAISAEQKRESLNELCILLYLHEVEGHMIQGRINTASLGTMNSDSVKNKIKIQFCSSLTPL